MLTLSEIEIKFEYAKTLEEPKKTKELVYLMNLLEKDYQTFIINPSTEDLNNPVMKLYQNISNERAL